MRNPLARQRPGLPYCASPIRRHASGLLLRHQLRVAPPARKGLQTTPAPPAPAQRCTEPDPAAQSPREVHRQVHVVGLSVELDQLRFGGAHVPHDLLDARQVPATEHVVPELRHENPRA